MFALAYCCCNGCSCTDPIKTLAMMLLIQLTMACIVGIAVLIKDSGK